MATQKFHIMPLHVSKLIHDPRVKAMSDVEFRAYINLLGELWLNDGLPNEPKILQASSQVSLRKLDVTSDLTRTYLYVDETNRVRDKFMEEVRAKVSKDVAARRLGAERANEIIAAKRNAERTHSEPSANANKLNKSKVNNKAYIKEEEYRVILTPLPFSNNIKKALMMHFKQRVDIKKPLTDRAAKLLVKPIEGWVATYGEASVIAQIEYSIKNSYQDIYEPKKAIETQVYVQPPKRVEQTKEEKETRRVIRIVFMRQF